MRLRGAIGAAALLATAFTTPVLASDPVVIVSEFDNPPQNINYFEDSSVILFQDAREGTLWRSEDAGASWNKVDSVRGGYRLIMHEFDPKRAYMLTEENIHWRTHDRGKTWEKWDSLAILANPTMLRGDLLAFHADDPDRIIFHGMECVGPFCEPVATYTTDGFSKAARELRLDTLGCWWARGSHEFTTGDKNKLDKDRILCLIRDVSSGFGYVDRLVISDTHFSERDTGQTDEFEPKLNTNQPVQDIVNVAIVKKYILVAAGSANTDEMALFVTDDTQTWHKAMFPAGHRLDHESYTVLESTNYSIQIDVKSARPENPMGDMFTSNSNGTSFTKTFEHTNRNQDGHVDFEKISGIQGVFLVNKVKNWEEVEKVSKTEKDIITEITFDDGRNFEDVKVKGGDRLHLHSVTEMHNVGRIFSSPAPGLVMGIGNTGERMEAWAKGSLYISDDAGRTWTEGPKGPHKYEFGDQGSILLAVKDTPPQTYDVKELTYSLDHGQTWAAVRLPDDLEIKPWILTTTQDSSSLKFLLTGETRDEKWRVVAIDFEGLHEDKCGKGDMEEWFARVGDDGKPTCLMGHTETYQRRKKDAKCFVKDEFNEVTVDRHVCDCTDMDFECDYNFRKEDGKCVQAGPVQAPEGACKNAAPDDVFKGTSGWRKIPGDDCKPTSETQKKYLDPVERPCSDSHRKPQDPSSGEITHEEKAFDGFDKVRYTYLERGDTSSLEDETIIAQPSDSGKAGPIFITHDHGKNWDTPKELQGQKIETFISHPHVKDMIFFLASNGDVYYTIDRGVHFQHFTPPTPPRTGGLSPFSFHPDKKDWMIWIGPREEGSDQHLEAYLSTDRGDNWKTIQRYVYKCEFTGSANYQIPSRKDGQIVCMSRKQEDPDKPWQLTVTKDLFEIDFQPREGLEPVKDFATMAEFIVVATQNKTRETLAAHASIDGETYADAHFPFNFHVDHQHGYTVLDSSTHAINLFVVTDTTPGQMHGSILKSNSNGTSYVLSATDVNCDDATYVDFEKIIGLEGVALINVVSNPGTNEPKKLQTKITHNDGGEWTYLAPPAADVNKEKYSCTSSRGDEKCALHLHGYTERDDSKKTFAAESAVGLMFGVGNVGSQLGQLKKDDETDTFMTTDGGISWTNVQKGRWTWQYGDQGSIVVLAQLNKKTTTIKYTLDEGRTWESYSISEQEVEITDLSTVRAGSSRNFLVWARKGGATVAINVDFTGLTNQACAVDEKDVGRGDYYLWSPEHPLQKNGCLFGHKSYYWRKKPESKCYNDAKLKHLYNRENCGCERADYECAYNYQLGTHRACHLVDGLKPKNPLEWCKENPEAEEYHEPTGYRRLPLTTCQGGKEYDKTSPAHACPGKEDEFRKKHRASGLAIFFAVTIPFALAAAAGWFVYRHWNGKFGQIRLGEQPSFDNDQPWVRYPIIALSAVVAAVSALPLVASSVWKSGQSLLERWNVGGGRGRYSWLPGGGGSRRFTTRDSFARSRGDYAIVDDDEGELLGEDSDEEA